MKANPAYLQNLIASVLASGLLFSTSGCLTRTVLSDVSVRHHSEAQADARLELFEASDHREILVRYTEVKEKNEATRRRAFYLYTNAEKIETGHKPHFVEPKVAADLVPIPLFPEAGVLVMNTPASGIYATVSTNGHRFTLHSGAHQVGPFVLPTYEDSGSKARRAMLTPFAVVGDAVFGTAALAAGYGFVWFTSDNE